MKDTNTMELAGKRNGAPVPATNGQSRLPKTAKESLPEKLPVLKALESALADSQGDDDAKEQSELKTRFVDALRLNLGTVSSLSKIVAEMIDSEVERDEAIDWGIEAGLSEGYVRSTVSRLYSDLTGRARKTGGGRKANTGAIGIAERVLKEYAGSFSKAKAALLAARRHVEKLEASAAKKA